MSGGIMKKPDKCRWKESEDGWWETQCRKSFEFTTDNLSENGFMFCPFCGKQIKAVSCGDFVKQIRKAFE
jgi:hypothetical protein